MSNIIYELTKFVVIMTIEEKAKAYDELLVKAKQIYNKENDVLIIHTIEEIFPELKESEDEKTKRILHSISSKMSFHLRDIFTEEEFQCFDTWSNAWLEKQAEQKPNPVLDIEIPFGAKDSELQEASYYIPEGFHAEINGNRVVIKRGEQKPAEWSQDDKKYYDGIVRSLSYLYDRTNAESVKDSLRRKMMWLKSLKDRVQPQQRQDWNEEDEYYRNIIIYCLNGECVGNADKENAVLWLKSLRPQNRWKPSEEQMKALDDIIQNPNLTITQTSYNELINLVDSLRKLKY